MVFGLRIFPLHLQMRITKKTEDSCSVSQSCSFSFSLLFFSDDGGSELLLSETDPVKNILVNALQKQSIGSLPCHFFKQKIRLPCMKQY